jgi:hypothetical protein
MGATGLAFSNQSMEVSNHENNSISKRHIVYGANVVGFVVIWS